MKTMESRARQNHQSRLSRCFGSPACSASADIHCSEEHNIHSEKIMKTILEVLLILSAATTAASAQSMSFSQSLSMATK